jgi:hypothetical protein
MAEEYKRPHSVKVGGADVLEMIEQRVTWEQATCEHDDGFTHETFDCYLGLLLGGWEPPGEETIRKEVVVCLAPEQAFTLGNLLIAAANRAPFLEADAPGGEEGEREG